MMYALRLAGVEDFEEVLRRTQAFNALEDIAIDTARLADGLQRLLAEPRLGGAWLVLHGHRIVGHAVVTYGYDLEFGGADAYLTEILVDEDARGDGAGTAAIALIEAELRARDIRALHLQVRADSPARRLYERVGFTPSPRLTMSKPL